MTIKFTVFDTATNEILRTGDAMTMAQALLQGNSAGTNVVTQGSDPVTQRIDNSVPAAPVVISKPPHGITVNKTTTAGVIQMLANGSDNVIFSGIYNTARCVVNVPQNLGITPVSPNPFTVSDGALGIVVSVPGQYTVTITDFPKVDYSVTLNAT